MNIENLMDYLVEHRAPNLPPGYLSEQLLSLSWILDDEGGQIFAIGKRWLNSSDQFRVSVALGLDEAFMADSWEELVELADSVKAKFPSMASDVDNWLNNSRRSYVSRGEKSISDGDAT
ncbi:hypothetical protein [Streptomyces erythrochromogenes]|uniref:hypothetical protein n=1 Tax=Streptomyces erythrochromogenes TaxID=285574 RepID=UPI0033EFC44F